MTRKLQALSLLAIHIAILQACTSMNLGEFCDGAGFKEVEPASLGVVLGAPAGRIVESPCKGLDWRTNAVAVDQVQWDAFWTPGSAAGECPAFAGREWEFTGHLVNTVSPGPPDYESVTSGDEPITRWYLQLPWPACFAEYNYLTRFQLSPKPEELSRYRHLLGKEIRVMGTLEKGVPGSHTTALVVNASSLVQNRKLEER